MSPLEAELKEKLAKPREIKSARDDKCTLLEVQIKALQEDLSEMSKPFDDEYKTLESGVRKIALQLARPFRKETKVSPSVTVEVF